MRPDPGRFPYKFANKQLVIDALTCNTRTAEQLEWLGDKVLGCCVAELLLRHYPERSEADLSRAIGRLVNNDNLHRIGIELGVQAVPALRPKKWIVANAMEAMLGAVFKDGGYSAATKCVEALLAKQVTCADDMLWLRDPKTMLKEVCESRRQKPPRFEVGAGRHEVICFALGMQRAGQGATKLAAETAAAAQIIQMNAKRRQ